MSGRLRGVYALFKAGVRRNRQVTGRTWEGDSIDGAKVVYDTIKMYTKYLRTKKQAEERRQKMTAIWAQRRRMCVAEQESTPTTVLLFPQEQVVVGPVVPATWGEVALVVTLYTIAYVIHRCRH